MKRTLAAAFLLLAIAPLAAAPGSESFGAPVKGSAKVEIAKLQESPDEWAGKTLATEGSVAAVCANKGCWMTLGQGSRPIRVTFKDYGFFVPKDIAGATAVVEGVFTVQTIPEATARHYAKETPGGKPDSIKGDQKELSIVATGVEIKRSK